MKPILTYFSSLLQEKIIPEYFPNYSRASFDVILMSMKTFYLFRHGLATKNLFGYGDKIVTAEVLPIGIPPVQRMAKFLKTVPTDFNVRSEFLRCKQTAAIVSDISGKQFTVDKRLNEYNQESFDAFRTRVKDFVDDIAKKPYENIVICTHGAVIGGLKNLITKNSFRLIDQYDYPKTGVLTIIKDGKIEEIDFNE